MGIGSSTPAKPRGIFLTLDALGTLYRFRAPVAQQYLTVARKCGLQSKIEENDLATSFRTQFKSMNSNFPNYGKSKLDNPETWWMYLVNQTFKEVTDDKDLPPSLAKSLYDHFSSDAAYELYPDVLPLSEIIRDIRSDEANPTLLVGVITNGDPRVAKILRSLGLKVGVSDFQRFSMQEIRQRVKSNVVQGGNLIQGLPFGHFYGKSNTIDFVTTSYDAGSEKPDEGIFQLAAHLADYVNMSKEVLAMSGNRSSLSTTGLWSVAINHRSDIDKMTWIHVGDNYQTDYLGAEARGLEALHLVRAGENESVEGVKPIEDGRSAIEGGKTISSLQDVGHIINLMLQEQKS